MGILDSSFLFFPFGNDLLVVAFVARNHDAWPFYVVSAVCGSTLGVFFLDLVARRAGEAGIRKVAGDKRYDSLKQRFEKHLAWGLILACLAPPPFPFTIVIAITSAMSYPRKKLFTTVAASRAVRFVILSLLAIRYGRHILRIMNTPEFKWTMILFVVLCIVGSVFSVMKWVKGRSSFQSRSPAAQPS
jgi:membrane protein YqaA with SNARE-associated domain